MIGIRGCDSWSEFKGTALTSHFANLLALASICLAPLPCLTNLVSHISFCSSQGLSRHGNAVFAHFAKRPLFSFQLLNVALLLADMVQGNGMQRRIRLKNSFTELRRE